MPILENRFKNYSKRSSHRISKSIFPSFSIMANFSALLISLIVVINPNVTLINNSLVTLNGETYSKIINPAKNFLSSTINFIVHAVNFNSLHTENLMLKMENSRIRNRLISTDKIMVENVKLSRVLNIALQENNNFLKAKVVFQSSSLANLAVIAAGSKDGVKPNSLVLVNGYLGGRIVTVGQNYSKLSLVSSYSSRIPVKTSDTGVHAILVGGSDKGGYLLHLHGSRKPNEGEVIVTSGDGSFYPQGIPVARVTKVTEKTVNVAVFSDLSDVDFVEILNPDNFEN